MPDADAVGSLLQKVLEAQGVRALERAQKQGKGKTYSDRSFLQQRRYLVPVAVIVLGLALVGGIFVGLSAAPLDRGGRLDLGRLAIMAGCGLVGLGCIVGSFLWMIKGTRSRLVFAGGSVTHERGTTPTSLTLSKIAKVRCVLGTIVVEDNRGAKLVVPMAFRRLQDVMEMLIYYRPEGAECETEVGD